MGETHAYETMHIRLICMTLIYVSCTAQHVELTCINLTVVHKGGATKGLGGPRFSQKKNKKK